ncbi:MAG: lysozyme inhibitor LprI family protein, partial [Pseudomonadota bacterium]
IGILSIFGKMKPEECHAHIECFGPFGRASDAEMASIGASVASQEEALRAMQRAWIAYRDATCDYEYSQWGGGTGGGPALIGCIMRETGEQTLYLLASRLGG